MAATLSPVQAVRDAIKTCSLFAKSSPDELEEDFKRLASPALQEGPLAAQRLLEYCVYRAFVTLGPSTLQASYKDPSFRKTTFSLMQAWMLATPGYKFQPRSPKDKWGPPIPQSAFLRIAAAVGNAVNVVTAYALFDTLTASNPDLSFETWDKYLQAFLRAKQQMEKSTFSNQKLLALQPGELVLAETNASMVKAADGSSVHGLLTLTNCGLYFQGDSRRLMGARKPAQRFELAADMKQTVQSERVGPLGTRIFDRALTITSDSESESWVLDFLEYSGHRQRDSWQAMIGEVLAMHGFNREYAPMAEDESEGLIEELAINGAKHAQAMAVEGIAQLQAVHSVLGSPPMHSERLLQFLWASQIPEGHLIEQALAVELWGERPAPPGFMQKLSSAFRSSLSTSATETSVGVDLSGENIGEVEDDEEEEEEEEVFKEDNSKRSLDDSGGNGDHIGGDWEGQPRDHDSLRSRVVVLEGSHERSAGRLPAIGNNGAMFPKSWMESPTWKTEESLSFWREKNDEGLWVGGPLIVGGETRLEKALAAGRAQESLAEKAQASIDGALIDGIPKNIDLLKELLFPLILLIRLVFVKAPRWDNPPLTIATAVGMLYLINSDFLWMLPSVSIVCSILVMLFLRLTRRNAKSEPFVFITKRSGNTLSKIVKLKQVLDTITAILQGLNITLLKCRTILFSDVPEATDKVILAALGLALALFVLAWFPFRLFCTLYVIHLFSRNMSFRRGKPGRQTIGRKLKHWWATIPVAPVTMVQLEKEVWEKEIKGLPAEEFHKEAIIRRLGMGDKLQQIDENGEAMEVSAEIIRISDESGALIDFGKDPSRTEVDGERTAGLKVLSRFIESEHS